MNTTEQIAKTVDLASCIEVSEGQLGGFYSLYCTNSITLDDGSAFARVGPIDLGMRTLWEKTSPGLTEKFNQTRDATAPLNTANGFSRSYSYRAALEGISSALFRLEDGEEHKLLLEGMIDVLNDRRKADFDQQAVQLTERIASLELTPWMLLAPTRGSKEEDSAFTKDEIEQPYRIAKLAGVEVVSAGKGRLIPGAIIEDGNQSVGRIPSTHRSEAVLIKWR